MLQDIFRQRATRILRVLSLLVVGYICGNPQSIYAQEAAAPEPQTTASEFPDLSIPPEASVEQLQSLVTQAKSATPRSPEQYQAMQTAIRDASNQLLKLLQEGSPARQQAEVDVIMSSVALLTYFSEKHQHEVVEQVHEFLKSRKKLSMQDIQTGMMAAAMLELQANKKPSRDTYQLLDQLLEKDEREEMQSLRLNLQAAVRRLNLLGSKFELDATTMDGKKVKTEDFAGKFVIVDFFATWCEPCLAEVPRLRKNLEKYGEKGLVILGISLDSDADALNKYLSQSKLPWPIIHDNAENPLDRLQMKFGVSSLPTVLLLNKEGTVVSLEARADELDRLMQMLFETPTPAAAPPQEADQAAKAQDGN